MTNPSSSARPGASLALDTVRAQGAKRSPPLLRVRRSSGDVRGALLLIAPLAAFMLVFFLVPVVMLMSRAVWDPVVTIAFPQTAQALGSWNGEGLPRPDAFSAAAADIVAADLAGTLGEAAARLNQDMPGMRQLLLRTRSHLDGAADDDGTPGADDKARQRDEQAVETELVAFDGRWGDAATWQVLANDVQPLTLVYLLRALDHERTPDGAIVPLPRDEGVYLSILGRTFWISAVVTVLVTLLGYPLSYWLTQLPKRRQRAVLMAVLIPFWTSILVRIAAWMVVLPRAGLVNRLATSLHLIGTPLELLYDRTGVIISMVHILIPFMVLPLFAVMSGIPSSYQRAAISLGSHPFEAFWRVYAPQTVPGVAAGALLVFISALGYYVAPALLGGAGDQMLSYYIAYYTNTTINWGLAAALSVLLLAATALLFMVYRMVAARRPVASVEA